MKEKNRKSWLCKIGIHKWQYCSAPFVLEGTWGKIMARVCKRCGYKDTNGTFIPQKNKKT